MDGIIVIVVELSWCSRHPKC